METIIRLVTTGLCSLFLLAPAVAQEPHQIERDVFESLCEYHDIDCTDIETPWVVYSQLTSALSKNGDTVWGVYVYGENHVTLHPMAPDLNQVAVHEISHYILYWSGLSQMLDRCDEEGIVRRAAGHPWRNEDKKLYDCT